MSRRNLWIIGLATCVLSLVWAGSAFLQCPTACDGQFETISGAVWTSTYCGDKVNGNLYIQACSTIETCPNDELVPFLNGGPLNCGGGKGLPDGDYFFQVTNPPGAGPNPVVLNAYEVGNGNNAEWVPEPLLTRSFTVKDGLIAQYPAACFGQIPIELSKFEHLVSTANPCVKNSTTGNRIALFAGGPAMGEDCIHRPTPNNGGEYKVYITPICRFYEAAGPTEPDPNDYDKPEDYYQALQDYFLSGFVGKYTKTDNFKVKAVAEQVVLNIFGMKFFDADVSTTYNPDVVTNPYEIGIQYWKIVLRVNGKEYETCTGSDGTYGFAIDVNRGATITYEVCEVLPCDYEANRWYSTTHPDNPCVTKTITIPQQTVQAIKMGVRKGTLSLAATIIDEPGPKFGNVCTRLGNCRTPGFWQNDPNNPNNTAAGNAARGLLDAGLYVDMLLEVPLVSEDNTWRNDPDNCRNGATLDQLTSNDRAAFQAWLVGKEVNCSLPRSCLSVHLATFWLNTHVDCSSNNNDGICCPGTAVKLPFNYPFSNGGNGSVFVSVSQIIADAKGLICGSDTANQLLMKDLLDWINNNGDVGADNPFYGEVPEFISQVPCPFTPVCDCGFPCCSETAYPEGCTSLPGGCSSQ